MQPQKSHDSPEEAEHAAARTRGDDESRMRPTSSADACAEVAGDVHLLVFMSLLCCRCVGCARKKTQYRVNYHMDYHTRAGEIVC